MTATEENAQRCPAFTRDGQPCQGKQTSSGYCIAHDPRANEWRARGGANSSAGNRAAKMLPSRLQPIVEGLERAFLAVETTNFDTKKANAMATVARALIAAFEAGEYEARIRLLEQQAADAGLFKDRYGNAKGAPLQWPTHPA
jgi:hypothetical protein